MATRGFTGRRPPGGVGKVPPGQSVTDGFPVLSATPTPRIRTEDWTFTLKVGPKAVASWNWQEFNALKQTDMVRDIHCVTKWSKLDTVWTGVSVDTLLEGVNLDAQPDVRYLVAFCDGGYTTNLPLAEVRGRKAWVVYEYDGRPLAPEHGGPARLLVPHLYFWKSAKWVRGLKLVRENRPGFWESLGYHDYGDPWKEQRYAGD